MKNIITSFLLLVSTITIAQVANSVESIPNGYYNTATGTGYTLKTQLFNIINDHNDRGYNGNNGIYVTYLTSDIDNYYENNGTMLDMYTENPTGTECEYEYGGGLQDDGTLGNAECQRYNREHLIPQSVYNSLQPMLSDAHCVVPSDKYVNAQRDSWPFSKVNNATSTYSNGSKKGSNLNSGYSAGYTGTVFEPIDEFKGDIARMILYFATRYEDQVSGWNYPMFNNTSNQVFTNQAINVLLTWHNNDPVSQRERDRNDAIYARQNNRNPYIDNPSYAMSIWGSLLNTETFNALNSITVYPNPSNTGKINIQSEVELSEINIITINGQLVQQIKSPERLDTTYELTNLPKGFYFLQLNANNQSVTKKIAVN
ncbi:endonuclease [Flavobacterium dankookense]|uniref:Putative secreted protein (Por secretion system target) n=1 Tax=Flavobacterium dankookense TaxID=706186 RepID=A0A4R6QEU7_9FLAO|nr:endonuclease [Flavobacterium dankookense]TDP60870.1 putative secreted protein (Por secretion system target) [Flavobacterium dankookense]